LPGSPDRHKPLLRLVALTCLAVLLAACGTSHETGELVGGIVPGGMHPIGTLAGGTVNISNPGGHVVASVTVRAGRRYDVRLAPGHYTLSVPSADQPCAGRVTVKANATTHANTVCEGK